MELDERQIKELASIQCTQKEIAAVMGCSVDTIADRYTEIINEGRESGKSSLRRAQWKKAVTEGNAALLIWLGKHYLEQRDEVHLTSTQEPEVKKLMAKIESLGKPAISREENRKAA